MWIPASTMCFDQSFRALCENCRGCLSRPVASGAILQSDKAKLENTCLCGQFPKCRAHPDMDSLMCVSIAELFEIPVENGLVGTTNTASSSSKSVLKNRSDDLDPAISSRKAGQSSANGIMGVTKLWDSSGVRPLEPVCGHLSRAVEVQGD